MVTNFDTMLCTLSPEDIGIVLLVYGGDTFSGC